MSRVQRIASSTNIYHIMMRGNNKQQIFYCEEDYLKYIYILQDAKKKFDFDLFAYCIMSNHIHILIRQNSHPLENIFKYIGARFVYWYNMKYGRSGHLFQGRFKSVAVENDEYFLTVLKYIHQNPIKAGICVDMAEYPYSSYKNYLEKSTSSFINTEFARNILNYPELIEFLTKPTDVVIETFPKIRIPDSEALKIINKYPLQTIAKANNQELIEIITDLKNQGLSVRQIARLSNLNYSKIKSI